MTKHNLYFAVTCAILISASFYLKIQHRETETPPQKPLESIPFQLNNFYGQKKLYDQNGFDSNSADQWILRNYRNGDGMPILLYFGYWENQNEHKKIRPPRFTKERWSYLRMESKVVGEGPVPINIKMFLNEKGAEQELVYYCYIINGKIIGNDYVFRFLNILNSILYGRTNAALLRVSMPVSSEWPLEKAESYEEEFLKEIMSFLLEYS